MPKRSAGILLYKRSAGELLVLLAHHGGQLWQKSDLGAWTIPKGEFESGEAPEESLTSRSPTRSSVPGRG